MDALSELRAEIEKKKKRTAVLGSSVTVNQAQKRWKRVGDLEAERKRKYLEEEERYKEEQEKKRLKKQQEQDALTASLMLKEGPSTGEKGVQDKTSGPLPPKNPVRAGDPPLNKKEVFRLLRAVGEPVTLFGEGPWERFDRLRELQLETEEVSEGQRNVFQKKMRELRAKDAEDDIYRYVGAEMPQLAKATGAAAASTSAQEKDAITKEDYVYKCIRHFVSLWQQEIDVMPSEERRTSKGRFAAVTCEQTKEWLKPLLKLLRKRQLKKKILNALRNIFAAVEKREYVKANSIYLEELAIGNAPWPMGATMVGIHARAAREKIGEDKIAHVMNDEQTRKYIQAVKRLVTVAQRHYPIEVDAKGQ